MITIAAHASRVTLDTVMNFAGSVSVVLLGMLLSVIIVAPFVAAGRHRHIDYATDDEEDSVDAQGDDDDTTDAMATPVGSPEHAAPATRTRSQDDEQDNDTQDDAHEAGQGDAADCCSTSGSSADGASPDARTLRHRRRIDMSVSD